MMSSREEKARRAKEMTVVHAVMFCLLFVLVLQYVLLAASLEAFLASHQGILLPAAVGSGICFLVAYWLVRFITLAENRTSPSKL
jgi:putative flippase GtrA